MGNINRRIALSESATALSAALLPSIEEVRTVTIIPRENYIYRKTVIKSEQDTTTFFKFTRDYLDDQLVMTLAGRAAEMIVYGTADVSTIAQERLENARRIVTKLIASASMSEAHSLASFRTVSCMSKGAA